MLADIGKGMHGKSVTVMGFLREVRDVGKLKFALLADVSGTVQLTLRSDTKPFDEIGDLAKESTIGIKGTVNENEKVSSGI